MHRLAMNFRSVCGPVRANAPAGNDLRAGRGDASSSQASQPVPLRQLVARGDPPGGDDVRPFPLSLRNAEDLLTERGIDICHETVRLWLNRFGPLFASDVRRQRVNRMRGFRQWKWHLDEVY